MRTSIQLPRCPLPRALPILLLSIFGASGCSSAHKARSAWLANAITEDNYALLQRESRSGSAQLLAGKYKKMAISPYYFFRGTLGLFYRDVARHGAELDLSTSFSAPHAIEVRVVADPHPENIGAYLPEGRSITVDFNDFDAASYGPYYLDLWRMMQGFDVAMRQAPGEYPDADRAEILRLVAEAYVDEIQARAGGTARDYITRGEAGGILDDLMRRAQKDGDEREALDEYTEVTDGVRRLRRQVFEEPEAEGVVGEETQDVSQAVQEELTALLPSYGESLEAEVSAASLRVKDVVRHIGSGVSSYALSRYYLLLEGPSEEQDDDWLIEAKEIIDAPSLGLGLSPTRRFDNNAERVVDAQRSLQVTRENDALLGWMASGAEAFKLRNRRKYQKGFDFERLREDLADGSFSLADVRVFAARCGRLLADAHVQAPTLSGEDAAEAIRAAIGGQGEAFCDEAVARTEAYTEQIMDDYASFVALLQTRGDWLGAR